MRNRVCSLRTVRLMNMRLTSLARGLKPEHGYADWNS